MLKLLNLLQIEIIYETEDASPPPPPHPASEAETDQYVSSVLGIVLPAPSSPPPSPPHCHTHRLLMHCVNNCPVTAWMAPVRAALSTIISRGEFPGFFHAGGCFYSPPPSRTGTPRLVFLAAWPVQYCAYRHVSTSYCQCCQVPRFFGQLNAKNLPSFNFFAKNS